MISYHTLGPAVFGLRDLSIESIWSLWKWKLDSYQIQDRTKIEQLESATDNHFAIVAKRGEVPAEKTQELLRDQKSGFFKRQVYRATDGGTIFQEAWSRSEEIVLQYHITPDWKQITLLQDTTNSAGLAAFEYLTQMIFYAMIPADVLTFHGVLMEHEGRGIILSAASGTGKTTHARMWRDEKRALILNGDRAACYCRDGQWTGYGMPWCGTSGEYMNREVPIHALVVLEQGPENIAKKLTAQECLFEIFPHVQYPEWDMELTDKVFEMLDRFLEQVPVWKLTCRPDTEAVEVLYNALKES